MPSPPSTLDAGGRLAAAGERVTRQRILIADSLAAAGRQLTADEVYRRLRSEKPPIGRATVFRTLERLVDAGVARRLERDGHVYAYVACQPAHHHHLSCTRCGRVQDIGEAYVRPMTERLAGELGFEVDDTRLDFYGRCARCRVA
jgi:Fur family transcriptional regulator, ferric uptake regulator